MGGIEWNRNKNEKTFIKSNFLFFLKLEKKNEIRINCHKTLIFILSNEKHKALLPRSHVKF